MQQSKILASKEFILWIRNLKSSMHVQSAVLYNELDTRQHVEAAEEIICVVR